MQSFTRQVCTAANIQRVVSTTTRPARTQRLYKRTSLSPQWSTSKSFTSCSARWQEASIQDSPVATAASAQKRKNVRSPAGKASLRRVAAEAQRPREPTVQPRPVEDGQSATQVIAVTAADQFDMEAVARILRSHGFPLNPDETDFESDQIIHTRGVNNGDIFVFPSGTVVAWGLPEDVVHDLATKTLLPAALRPHINQPEMENLEYTEDHTRDTSGIKGDIITLGTNSDSAAPDKPQ